MTDSIDIKDDSITIIIHTNVAAQSVSSDDKSGHTRKLCRLISGSVSSNDKSGPTRKQCLLSFGAITTLVTCSEDGESFELQPPIEGNDCFLSRAVSEALRKLSGDRSSYYTLRHIPSEHQGKQYTDGLTDKRYVSRKGWPLCFAATGDKELIDGLKSRVKPPADPVNSPSPTTAEDMSKLSQS